MPINDSGLLELKAEVKELKEDGTFSGVASVYGVEDLGGDVIDKGAFSKTVAENPDVLILWQHQAAEVIGSGSVKEWQNKILINGQLDLEDPTGQKAYQKLKKKLIKGLSIGFQTIKATWEEIEENGRTRFVRHIQELKLWEISVVTFPMLPAAQVTRVKHVEDDSRLARVEERLEALSAKLLTTPNGAGEGEGAAEQRHEPEDAPLVLELRSSVGVFDQFNTQEASS